MSPATPAELYLDLLKKCLTDTLFGQEPDVEGESAAAYLTGFIGHYIRGRAISMLPLSRLDNLQQCVLEVVRRNVPGDLMEAGVWRGGATVLMRGILAAYGVHDRRVWAADSFEGLPRPDAAKFPREAKCFDSPVMQEVYGRFAVSLEEVRSNFAKFGLLDDQVVFLKGWFRDTLPTAPIERLAVLRLDGDYYESTMSALSCLYDRLSVGGYIIVDDYGEDDWTCCRQAVDVFRQDRAIDDAMIRVDSRCFFWQRSR